MSAKRGRIPRSDAAKGCILVVGLCAGLGLLALLILASPTIELWALQREVARLGMERHNLSGEIAKLMREPGWVRADQLEKEIGRITRRLKSMTLPPDKRVQYLENVRACFSRELAGIERARASAGADGLQAGIGPMTAPQDAGGLFSDESPWCLERMHDGLLDGLVRPDRAPGWERADWLETEIRRIECELEARALAVQETAKRIRREREPLERERQRLLDELGLAKQGAIWVRLRVLEGEMRRATSRLTAAEVALNDHRRALEARPEPEPAPPGK